ncbi:MAG TPA: ABC transporter substrate binding protein [Dissulfurispiraceae bacterium]
MARRFFSLVSFLMLLLHAGPSESADVLIIGDAQLKPVADMIALIEGTLPSRTSAYSPSQISGRARAVVSEENAKVVLALGKDAVEIAATLPEPIPVIYGMLVAPPRTNRQNITGVYMETPVREYLDFVNRSFPGIKKIGVLYGQETERLVRAVESSHIRAVKVKNSYEFANAVGSLNTDALLLLPDRQLLSPAAVEAAYLFSFRKKIPVLGLSERHVKEGSLFALVFDLAGMGRQLGEMVKEVLAARSADGIPPAPPLKLNLYVNADTAKKMGISIPDEVLRRARRVFP